LSTRSDRPVDALSEPFRLDPFVRDAESFDRFHEAVDHRVDTAGVHLDVRWIEPGVDPRLWFAGEPAFEFITEGSGDSVVVSVFQHRVLDVGRLTVPLREDRFATQAGNEMEVLVSVLAAVERLVIGEIVPPRGTEKQPDIPVGALVAVTASLEEVVDHPFQRCHTGTRREEDDIPRRVIVQDKFAVRPTNGDLIAHSDLLTQCRGEFPTGDTTDTDLQFVLRRRVRERVRTRGIVVVQADILAGDEIDRFLGPEPDASQHRSRSPVSLGERADPASQIGVAVLSESGPQICPVLWSRDRAVSLGESAVVELPVDRVDDTVLSVFIQLFDLSNLGRLRDQRQVVDRVVLVDVCSHRVRHCALYRPVVTSLP